MKITIENQQMTTYWKLCLILLLGLFVLSCKKNESEIVEGVSTDEAVEIISKAISSESYGLVSNITEASEKAKSTKVYTEAPTINCGQGYQNNFTADESTNNYSYNYSINATYLLNCTAAKLPQAFTYTHNLKGTYDTNRMESDDTAQSSFSITGLEVQADNAVLNGEYNRTGSQDYTLANAKEFDSKTSVIVKNINLNKVTAEILSGTASVNLEVIYMSKAYKFSGNIVFNGNDSATITVNGATYTIQLD